ncbi:MAG TPA: peptidylprolyl isomerase [Bryobacteraceae bacterium]|jgi:parvulin-like peptidyl-prolyl isomerase|nr:peptidylprolyl isomerase [Bryobacteraceae bacterium]
MLWKQILISASVSISLYAQAPAADPQKVVATIAGKDITVADVQKMTAMFSAQDLQQYQQNPQFILSQFFLFLHLAEEGDKLKLLEKSPYKEQYEGLKLQLERNARINEENNTFPVSPEMIDKYYQEHSAQYEQAKIKVIYIAYAGQETPKSTDPASVAAAARAAVAVGLSKRSEADARTLAADIVKQLRGGADFVKLVAQYSEDAASKAAGGDFGLVKAVGEYPAELKTAVFALKPGEISEPIRQPTAYYIVRLEEKGSQPVDEVREKIIQTIRNDHMNQWMKDMNASYQAVIKDPEFFKTSAPAVPPALAPNPKQ